MNFNEKSIRMKINIIYFLTGCIIMLSCTGVSSQKDSGESFGGDIIEKVSFIDVKINDKFWKPKIDSNRINGIRSIFEAASYSLDNFGIAAGKKEGNHKGTKASDSDVFKIIEGAAYSLHHYPDKELEEFIDILIDNIVAAQQDDGYLNTYFIINDQEKRWENIERWHELYCAGHMFEAAVAYYQVTGKRKLLDSAIKLADHIDSIFGPGKRIEVPGHQEIELALYKLYKVTGENRYLDLSMFFIGERGNPERIVDQLVPPEHDPNAGTPRRWRHPSYFQDHLPFEEQFKAIGHAVRAVYLYSGVTDISIETRSNKYLPALDSLWNDIVKRNLYVTGGIGTNEFHDEGFGTDYLLPNATYCETCSGIGLTFWNRRMNFLHGDAKYADMLELTMYNSGLSGVSLEGDRFFYTNPLVSSGRNQRRPWFEPGCCPSNMVRFLPQTGSNIYAKTESEIYINQFIASKTSMQLEDCFVSVIQNTNYPWEGEIEISINPETASNYRVNIRIPGWARGEFLPGNLYHYLDQDNSNSKEPVLKVNGKRIHDLHMNKGYAVIDRRWEPGDKVTLALEMPVRLVAADPRVEENLGKVVILRGPMVYCIEQADNKNINLDEVALDLNSEFTLAGGEGKLKGMTILKAGSQGQDLTIIPYFAWANREPGNMKVWIDHK